MTSRHRVTHIGLCVRDLQRSITFYCAALGFAEVGSMRVTDEESARLLALDGLDLDLVYLQRGEFRLELLAYNNPPISGADEPRAMNSVGLTHLSFRVDDIDTLAAGIVEHGGRMLTGRIAVFPGGNRGMMLTDPDGTLLELIERAPGHQ